MSLVTGARVMVWFADAGWCSGAIEAKKKDGKYAIAFDDGDRDNIPPSEVRLEDEERMPKLEEPDDEPDEVDIVHFEAACVSGDKILAMDCKGIWCEARVLETRDAVTTTDVRQFKVHFKGWSKSFDEWISAGARRARPLPLEMRCVKGTRLEARDSKGIWCHARVVDVREPRASGLGKDARHVQVHFDGWAARWDEWVPVKTGRLRALPLDLTCEIGDRVCARDSYDLWCEARVIDIREQPRQLKLHFLKWSARYDEWVHAGVGRVRQAGTAGTAGDAAGGDDTPRGDCEPRAESRALKEMAPQKASTAAQKASTAVQKVPAQKAGAAPRAVPREPFTFGEGGERLKRSRGGDDEAVKPATTLKRQTSAPLKAAVKAADEYVRASKAAAPAVPPALTPVCTQHVDDDLGLQDAQPPLPLAERAVEPEHSLASPDGATSAAVAAQRLLLFAQPDAPGLPKDGAASAALPTEREPPCLKAMREQLQCPLCMRTLVRPHVLPCQHAYCADCLDNLSRHTWPSSHCIRCKAPYAPLPWIPNLCPAPTHAPGYLLGYSPSPNPCPLSPSPNAPHTHRPVRR